MLHIAMAAEDWRNKTFGTEAAGFRLWREAAPSTLRIVCWGYWPPEVAATFAHESVAALKGLPTPVSFLLDAGQLRPQGDAGQQALLSLMKALAGVKISRASVLANDILMRMQLVRLANECSINLKKVLGLVGPT